MDKKTLAHNNEPPVAGISSQSSRKIVLIQFIASIMVVFFHSNGYKNFDVKSELVINTMDYLKTGVTFACVSIFAFLSGFLLFKGISNAKSNTDFFLAKIKSRIKSIAIPFWIWNTFYMLITLVVTVVPFLSATVSDDFKKFDFSIISVFKGVFVYEYCITNWYMFYLLKYILFSPLIYLCIKNKKTAIIFMVLAFVYSGLKIELLPDIINFDCRYNLFFMFCLGACISIHNFDWINKLCSQKVALISLVGAIATTVVYFALNRSSLHEYIRLYINELLTVSFVLLLWHSLDTIKDIKLIGWMKNSFFIYLAHPFLLLTISKAYSLIYNKFALNQTVGAMINLLVIPVVTIIIIEIAACILKRYFKNLWLILTGSRG